MIALRDNVNSWKAGKGEKKKYRKAELHKRMIREFNIS